MSSSSDFEGLGSQVAGPVLSNLGACHYLTKFCRSVTASDQAQFSMVLLLITETKHKHVSTYLTSSRMHEETGTGQRVISHQLVNQRQGDWYARSVFKHLHMQPSITAAFCRMRCHATDVELRVPLCT